jgi:hypothetical protein
MKRQRHAPRSCSCGYCMSTNTTPAPASTPDSCNLTPLLVLLLLPALLQITRSYELPSLLLLLPIWLPWHNAAVAARRLPSPPSPLLLLAMVTQADMAGTSCCC